MVKALEGLVGFLEGFEVVSNPVLGRKRQVPGGLRWQSAEKADSGNQACKKRGKQGVPPRTE